MDAKRQEWQKAQEKGWVNDAPMRNHVATPYEMAVEFLKEKLKDAGESFDKSKLVNELRDHFSEKPLNIPMGGRRRRKSSKKCGRKRRSTRRR
jgi:hypothetical protein